MDKVDTGNQSNGYLYSGQTTPSHHLSGCSTSVHRASSLRRVSTSSSDTHITPIPAARRDVRIGVTHAITDLKPVPVAVGELGYDSGIKAGRVSTVIAQHAARIQRPINARAFTALVSHWCVQARAGTDGEAEEAKGVNGHSDMVSRQSAREKKT